MAACALLEQGDRGRHGAEGVVGFSVLGVVVDQRQRCYPNAGGGGAGGEPLLVSQEFDLGVKTLGDCRRIPAVPVALVCAAGRTRHLGSCRQRAVERNSYCLGLRDPRH